MAKMHVYIFDDMVQRASKELQLPTLGMRAMDWFRKAIQDTYEPKDVHRLFEDSRRLKTEPILGKMYFFSYDPKHKETLPFYDAFPFVLPIDFSKDGFLGLNMHYLPYRHRAKLMDGLIRTVSDERFDERTKMRVTYDILQSVAKYKLFRPTLKKYLFKHVRSQLVEVHSKEWPLALFLPVQQWHKASQNEVWRDSMKER